MNPRGTYFSPSILIFVRYPNVTIRFQSIDIIPIIAQSDRVYNRDSAN